jgi:hypothetical protein
VQQSGHDVALMYPECVTGLHVCVHVVIRNSRN